jgi:PST family polysaccharide transporter
VSWFDRLFSVLPSPYPLKERHESCPASLQKRKMNSSLGTKLEQSHPEEHFRTDHLLADLGHRAVSGGMITIGAQAAKFLLNFLAAAVLARLLGPNDFGLIGMVLGVTGLVGVLKELGLSTATVQRESITKQQVSNLFWINVAFSGVLTSVCAGMAPLMAKFYHDPRVTGVMLALSFTFLLTGSQVQHQALLARQMRFHAVALIDAGALGIGFAVACILAWIGYGYWALVIQQLVYAGSGMVLTWCTSKWRPIRPTRNSGVGAMVKFGAHLTIADFIGQAAINSDNILIGRYFGAAPLGLYTRASLLLAKPIQQVVTPIGAVIIPVLSRLQSDTERYRRSYMRAYDTIALFIFSFSAVSFVLAKPLVLVILGAKWKDSIPLFAAFTLVAISGPLALICSWIYESQGRGREQLRNHILAGSATLGSYVLGLHWGPIGVIYSIAVVSLLVRLPLVYYLAGRRGPVRTRDLWAGFVSHIPCWVTVFAATSLAYKVLENAIPIVQLFVCGPVGLILGAALFVLFPRPRQGAVYMWNTLKNRLTARAVAQ